VRDGDMKNKKLTKRKDAVAGVIEALLLVALVAIIISTIQLVYIPQMMEQRESDHMDDAENQFSYLKSVIDLQSIVKEDVPISSPITLGSRELPYFVTARAFGQLDIIDIDRTDSKIVTDPWMGFPYANIPLTSIKYKAHNSYFVDQTYVLEGGCVIVKQPDGETVKIEPAITVENETKINIIYNMPLITGVPGKNSTSGYKNCFVRTNYSYNETCIKDFNSAEDHHVWIYTDYLNAWNASLNKLLEEEVENGYVNVTITQDLVGIDVVEIEPWGKTIHLEITVTYIGAQIGPGIVII
jgi:hypothetical protein